MVLNFLSLAGVCTSTPRRPISDVIQDWSKLSLSFVAVHVLLAVAAADDDGDDGYRRPATSRVFLGGGVRPWRSSGTDSRRTRRAAVG